MADSASKSDSRGFALHCRGDVRLFHGHEDCTPKAKKGRALLAVLAAEQRPLSRVKLIDLLWSDRQEEQARASLRTLLADLKSQFNSRFDDLLVVDRERIALGSTVRTDLTDLTLARPWGELFEGLDHVDPELDEWLRLERAKWSDPTFAPAVERAISPDSRVASPRKPLRWSFAILAIGATLAALLISPGLRSPPASSSTSARLDEARALLLQSSPAAGEKARRILIDVVEAHPNHAGALAMLAEATMEASDHPSMNGTLPLSVARREARAYSLRAIKLAPGQAAGWAALGYSQFATAASVRPLEKAVELSPNMAKYRWELGRALEYQNRYDEAYLHLRRAIELDPQSAEPVVGFVRVAVQLDRTEEMKAQTLAFERRRPRPDDLAYAKGYLANQLGDEAGCIRNLEPLVAKGDYRPLSTLIFCLTSLGEKRRAAELSAGLRTLRADVLREDAAAVERRARSMGRDFWLRNFESLAAADLLVEAGKSRALVQSFDASYDSIAEFEREGSRVAMEPTSLLLAMQLEGRSEDARQMRDILAKQASAQRDGHGLTTWSLFAKAAVHLADGKADQAVALLERCYPDCLVGILEVDISETAFFGRLNGNPRFDALVRRYRDQINARRKQAGLPSLAQRPRP